MRRSVTNVGALLVLTMVVVIFSVQAIGQTSNVSTDPDFGRPNDGARFHHATGCTRPVKRSVASMAYFRGREATAIALAGAVPVMQRQGLWVYHKAGGSKQAIKDFAASKPDHIRRSMNEEGPIASGDVGDRSIEVQEDDTTGEGTITFTIWKLKITIVTQDQICPEKLRPLGSQ